MLYFGLVMCKSDEGDLESLRFWVGILMLISAGSFLYVATIHILPEVYDTSSGHDHAGEGSESHDATLQGYNDLRLKNSEMIEAEKKKVSKTCGKGVQLFALLTGLYLPILL